jgi:hypothetical protein
MKSVLTVMICNNKTIIILESKKMFLFAAILVMQRIVYQYVVGRILH